jgi:hypothetical protein
MTLGAIHDVSLAKLQDRINDFGKVIKPGGRGYFPLNLGMLLQNTELHEFAELFDLSRRQTLHDAYRIVRQQCEKIKYKIIALDINFLDYEKDRYERLAGPNWPSWNDYLNDNITDVDQEILSEISLQKLCQDPFVSINTNDLIDGNIKLVFEV